MVTLSEMERSELVVLRARMVGVDQLTINYEECKQENEKLRGSLLAYDEVVQRLQNYLECCVGPDPSSVSSPSSKMFSDVLSENQQLKRRLLESEQRFQVRSLSLPWRLGLSCVSVTLKVLEST